MGEIRLEDGRVVVDWSVTDETGLKLPESIEDDLVIEVFSATPGDEAHIAAWFAFLSEDDKRRFEVACDLCGRGTDFARASLDWAEVGANGNWKNVPLDIVWSDRIGSSLIDEIFVTRDSTWFVTVANDGTIMTDAEFTARFSNDIRTSLKRFVKATEIKLTKIIEIMDSPLVGRSLTIERAGCVFTEVRHGPEAAPVTQWRLKPDETFLAEG